MKGSASTQLMYYGFEVLDQDPYFIPVTEEELEDIGKFLVCCFV
jgi:ribosome assembly protein 1